MCTEAQTTFVNIRRMGDLEGQSAETASVRELSSFDWGSGVTINSRSDKVPKVAIVENMERELLGT